MAIKRGNRKIVLCYTGIRWPIMACDFQGMTPKENFMDVRRIISPRHAAPRNIKREEIQERRMPYGVT